MPGVALAGRGRLRPLAGLDPLPLAVHVRGGTRLGLAEHVGMAPDDLGRDRRPDVGHVEHALLGGELRVEDDLEEEIPELTGELRRGTALERVVDLVRLLEQVVAQRLVRLLPVPRTAVGLPEAGGDPGHPPRRGDVGHGRDGREVQRRREVLRAQLADRRPVGETEPSDRVLGRVQAPQDGDRIRAVAAMAARERLGNVSRIHEHAHPGGWDDEQRDRRLDRRRDESFHHDDPEPGRGVEPPAQASFSEERVQHRAARLSASGRRFAGDALVARDVERILLPGVPERERRGLEDRSLRGVRLAGLLLGHEVEVQALALDDQRAR